MALYDTLRSSFLLPKRLLVPYSTYPWSFHAHEQFQVALRIEEKTRLHTSFRRLSVT